MMQCPMEFRANEHELAWSKQMESVRKDVECFFGHLKRRFAILRCSVEYQSQDAINNAFYACCILHNMLHEYDGRDIWRVCT